MSSELGELPEWPRRVEPASRSGSGPRKPPNEPASGPRKPASEPASGPRKPPSEPASGPGEPEGEYACGSGSSPSRRASRELSAGGVVVRGEEVLVIVPTRRAADGSLVLALPKGHVDEGESPLAAAIREVREEAGVVVEPVIELGEVRYWYMRGGRRVPKSVFFFLFRYLSGDPADHDHEVIEARWMGLEQARRELTYAGEREMVARALALAAQDR